MWLAHAQGGKANATSRPAKRGKVAGGQQQQVAGDEVLDLVHSDEEQQQDEGEGVVAVKAQPSVAQQLVEQHRVGWVGGRGCLHVGTRPAALPELTCTHGSRALTHPAVAAHHSAPAQQPASSGPCLTPDAA
jgi:hypothetical protein